MASRVQELRVFPWDKGVVTSLDESLIPFDALTQGDNITFATQGTRRKREGIDLKFDSGNDPEAFIYSSSGTTRTLVTTGRRLTADNLINVTTSIANFSTTSGNVATASPYCQAAISAVDDTAETITVAIHLNAGDPVVLLSGTPPTGLSLNRIYFARSPSVTAGVTTCQLAEYVGGAAINLTSTTTGAVVGRVEDNYSVTGSVTISLASPGVVTLTGHGISTGTLAKFAGASLPAAIVAGRWYRVVRIDDDTFSLQSDGSTAVNTAAAGSGTVEIRYGTQITYTFTGAASASVSTAQASGWEVLYANPFIKSIEYWYDNGTTDRSRFHACLDSAGRLWEITTSGIRNEIYDFGTAYTVPATGFEIASMVIYENRLIVAVKGQVMKHFFPIILGGTSQLLDVINTASYVATPKASTLSVHLGRLYANDAANPDRLHYSETGAYNVWQGAGDSGALDLSPGDGDPDGVVAIAPSFKGNLFVGKRTKLYRIIGTDPLDFQAIKVTDGLGFASPNGVTAVDESDVVFVSDRGIHSLATTDAFGDFNAGYLSDAIQADINDRWELSKINLIQAAYIPTLNSVAFTVTESPNTAPNSLWFYNVPQKKWFRWPNIACRSIHVSRDSDRIRFYLGTPDGDLAKAQTNFNYDIDRDGEQLAISLVVKTGLIFPDGSPTTIKGFKRISLIYKPVGTYNITVSCKIDNFSAQPINFSEAGGGQDLLGDSFVLGSSSLGFSAKTQAYSLPIDGFGRGIQLTVSQSGTNEFGEILGYAVSYEMAEYSPETRGGDDR